jgi:rubrerythrin
MTKMDNPQAIAKYINCLSILEDRTALLYINLSERVETPLTKSLLLSISKDSSKHSILLKGIAHSISDSKQNRKDCAKKLGEVWDIVTNYLNKVNKKNKMSKLGFSELLPKLTALESSLGEEYYVFVQMKTLQLMAKEINQLYGIDLENIKKVFESVIRDEEHHREILATITAIISKKLTKKDNTPIVKYQNPDAWIHSLPPTTYDPK